MPVVVQFRMRKIKPWDDDEQGDQEVKVAVLNDIHIVLLQTEPARVFCRLDVVQHSMQERAGDDDGREETDEDTECQGD